MNWNTIDQITFEDLVGKTAPSTVSAPELDTSSYRVDDQACQEAIAVSAEAFSRFYNGIYLIRKCFEGQESLPETAGLMHAMIGEKLIKPLSQVYPIFEGFEFEINSERMSIIGLNDTANTILNAMNEIARTPVDFHEDGLPQHKQVSQMMEEVESARDEGYDEDYDENNWEENHDW